jgi:hypothetical protein
VKKKRLNESLESTLEDPYSLFVFAMNSPQTREKYITRLDRFFRFTDVQGNTIQERHSMDEGHLLETGIVKFRGLSISKRRWKRYIHDLKIIDYGYDNVERWIDFLIELETKMLTLTGNSELIESFSIERKVKYNYSSKGEKTFSTNRKVVPASDLFDSDAEIAEKYDNVFKVPESKLGDELTVDATRDIERLTRAINNILANPKNWIVSEIVKENYDVVKVELKPLDISLL